MSERHCNKCNQTKPVDQMVKANYGYAGNYKPLCKVCKNIETKAYRERKLAKKESALANVKQSNKLTPTQIKSCGLGGYRGPRERDPNEALPNRVDKMSGHFIPSRDLPVRIGLARVS